MSRLPDLVQDAELQTEFRFGYTVHIYTETGLTARERSIRRQELWKREKLVGGGAFGRVYLERCVQGQGAVEVRAVKELLKSPRSLQQVNYNRELEAISKFSHRKYERCFVKSFGWYEDESTVFIAMEYLELGDLHHYLNSKPPLTELDVQQVTSQILEGLYLMHENGFSHRDLKPGNILVKSSPPDPWWVKLGDFGITKRAAEGNAASSTLQGTPRYMAPELFGLIEFNEGTESEKSQAADIWALGEITFQMLTKEPTFYNLGHLSNYVRSPENFPWRALQTRHVSGTGINFIRQVMQPRPGDRPTAGNTLSHPWIVAVDLHSADNFLPTVSLPEAIEGVEAAQNNLLPTASARWSTVSGLPQPSRKSSTVATAHSAETLSTATGLFLTNPTTLDSDTHHVVPQPIGPARYFILKSSCERDIETSSAFGIWCCGGNNNVRLSNAFRRTNAPIYLIFSVNESRKFCGVAQMKSVWNPNITTEHWEDARWEGGFFVNWLSWTPVEFDDVKHLKHKEADGVSITRAHFVLELCHSTGVEMMRRFGVLHLVPHLPQQSDHINTASTLGVSGLNLAAHTAASYDAQSNPAFDPAVLSRRMDLNNTRSMTTWGKMEIEDSEDE